MKGRDLTSFGQYSGEAMRVLFSARRALESYGGDLLTPEYMLVGILDEPKSEASTRLAAAGIAVSDLRDAALAAVATGAVGDVDAPLSPSAERVLDLAVAAAAPGHIRSVHLIVGILREGSTEAARALRAHRVSEGTVGE